ncbi:MAG TPA: adenine deaminase C-terminal domain-containing protein [Candidatus Dormibacteraeota bacterium]|nr:adenine deaminase C-terminal domain-containing protein [Candidatus Dormibacteraeota bacterium]
MTVRFAPDVHAMRRLVAVARRSQPADLVITSGALLDVYTEEILEGWGLVIAEGRVAYAGPDVERFESAARIEGRDHVIAPGLVEAHTHLFRMGLSATIPLQVESGVTTTVLETMELGYILGPDGVRELLADAAGMPGRVLLTIPPLTGLDPVYERDIGVPGKEWVGLLDLPGVVGVGETNWVDVIRGNPRVEALAAGAHVRGLTIEGHGAGAREAILNPFAAYGISADHEGIAAEDTLNRLRLGYWTMVRQGAIRRDLEAISALWKEGRLGDFGRLALVSDSLEPEELLARRSLNQAVGLAVENGLPLARAVRLASRNPAERFGLGRWVGGLAPGMFADLILLPRDEPGVNPRLVLVGGRTPAEPVKHRYPPEMLHTLTLGEPDPAWFAHPGRGRWRAIELVAPLVTREVETDGSNAIVATVVDRMGRRRAFRGLLAGLGLKGGACAVSAAWDTPCLVVVGDSEPDMAIALRRLRELQGGAVVVSRGTVLAEFRAELAGVLSLAPAAEVVSQVTAVNRALDGLGCAWPNSLLSIETLTTGVIPHLRLWAEGYVRLKDGAHLGLNW